MFEFARRNSDLQAENARLKRQLEKIMSIFAVQERSANGYCPPIAGLKGDNSKCYENCQECWRKALEEVT